MLRVEEKLLGVADSALTRSLLLCAKDNVRASVCACVCVCVAFRAQLNCANENIGSYDDEFGVRSQSTRYNRTKLLTFEQLSLASGILSRFNFCEVRRSSLQSVANFSICAR